MLIAGQAETMRGYNSQAFLALAVTLGLAVLGLPDTYKWLAPWCAAGAALCFIISVALFLKPNLPNKLEESNLSTGPLLMMAAAVVIFLCGLAWNFWPKEPDSAIDPEKMPNALDLFMLDTENEMKLADNMNLVFQANTQYTIRGPNAKDETVNVLYNIVYHFKQNIKVIVFYVPFTLHYSLILENIAKDYGRLLKDIEDKHYAYAGSVNLGERSAISKDMVFTGVILIYSENDLDMQELVRYGNEFTNHGARLIYRDHSYALSIWQAVQNRQMKQPTSYRIVDDKPEKVQK